MTDRVLRILLVLAAVILAVSLVRHPHRQPPGNMSDNGVVPPHLLQQISTNDAPHIQPATSPDADEMLTEIVAKERTCEVYNIRPIVARMQSVPRARPDNPAITHDEAVVKITQLILETATPDQWTTAGGLGDVREVGGLLIVNQRPRAQREIATLLTRLDAELRK